MAATKRPGRQRNQLPHCYFEGFLEKRSFKDKTSRKLWTSLCGSTLFFFNNNKDCDYIEKVDLDGFISLTDDSSRGRNLDAARLNLRLNDGEIKLTAPSQEARELWKGYIYSVVKLSVPPTFNLLPGQINLLQETVEKEKERIKALPPPRITPAPETNSNPYVSLVGDMPACFHQVSRMQAQLILGSHPERGNMLLRPGGNGSSFAITTREDLNGPVFKHYRLTREHNGGFAIDLEQPIPCATLYDAINYMVENTGGALIPFTTEDAYERNLTFVQSNEENGEKSIQSALSKMVPPPTLPPKPVQRMSAPIPDPECETEERIYQNDSTDEEEEDDAHHILPMRKTPLPHQTSLPSETTQSLGFEKRKPLMPPSPALRFNSSSSASSSPKPPAKSQENVDRTRRLTVASVIPDPSLSEELRVKLERRRMLQQ